MLFQLTSTLQLSSLVALHTPLDLSKIKVETPKSVYFDMQRSEDLNMTKMMVRFPKQDILNGN